MTTFTPIALFVYNRLQHTQRTIESLKKNLHANESILYIFSDGPKAKEDEKKVEEVRDYLKYIDGFKKIERNYRSENRGLASSIITGVTEIFQIYDKVIVLEDDLITSPYFLDFMNRSLEYYDSNKKIFSITGFNFDHKFMNFPGSYKHDVYLNIRPMSWSWGTWKDRWTSVDWTVKDFQNLINNKKKIKKLNTGGTDLILMLTSQIEGKIDSWYIRWSYYAVMNDLLTVYPVKSLVNNIGFDGTGAHCRMEKIGIYSHKELCDKNKFVLSESLVLDKHIVKRFNRAFNFKYIDQGIKIIKKYVKKSLLVMGNLILNRKM